MKHLLLFLLLTGIINAQTIINTEGSFYWADSLWNDILVDTSATPDDTTAASLTSEKRLNFGFEWMYVTAIDTGATYTDSIAVEYGTIVPTPDTINAGVAYMAGDTLWNAVQFMRDSTWTNVNSIVGANAHSTYAVYVGGYDLIRFRIKNATTVEDRVWKFRAILSRKK
jgi:hypothetical protein